MRMLKPRVSGLDTVGTVEDSGAVVGKILAFRENHILISRTKNTLMAKGN